MESIEVLSLLFSDCDIQNEFIEWLENFLEGVKDESLDLNADDIKEEQNALADAVYTQTDDGDTLLHQAIICLNEARATSFMLIATSHHQLAMQNDNLQTPIILAAATNQVSVLRSLMICGANISHRNKRGETALHIACREGYHDIAKALLKPVKYTETQKLRPVYDLPYQPIPQDLSVTDYEGNDCLHLAAMRNDLDLIELLIQNGADVNSKCKKAGYTVLHLASMNGNLEIVQYLLLLHKIQVDAVSFSGLTPFDLARLNDSSKHLNIRVILAARGASLSSEIRT